MQVRATLLFWFIYKHCILRRAWSHQSMFNRNMIYQNKNIKGTRKKKKKWCSWIRHFKIKCMRLSSRKIAILFHCSLCNGKNHSSQRKETLAKPKDFVRLLSCLLQIITRIILKNFPSVIYPPCIPGTEESMYSKVENKSLCRCSTNAIK